MAEVVTSRPVRGRMERPGRTAARRARYDARMAAARTSKQMLSATCDFIRAMFADYGPQELTTVCHALAEAADSERRRVRGVSEDD